MIRKISYPLLIFAVILAGFILRAYRLDQIPSGFFADEASIGYNAYTILTKGTDEYGTKYPLFFKAFGEYKSPIQTYSTVPMIKLFGLNEFSVRLTSALYGTLAVIALYLLTKEIFRRERKVGSLSALSAFFLAISPWHIHFSRVSLEGLMAFVFFTTLGLYFFLKAQRVPKLLLISLPLFGLGLYSYFPARIFIPLFGISLFVLYFRFFLKNKKETLFSALLTLLLLAPFVQNALSPVGFARWQQVSIFTNPPTDRTIPEHLTVNYLRHFSPDFLFLKGDIDMPGQFITRHSVRGMGQLYLFQLPLIAAGLIFMFKIHRKIFLILLLWLLIHPVGSMLTIDKSPQATRSIIGVVPWQIFSAAGVVYLSQYFLNKKPLAFLTYAGSSAVIIIAFLANYLVHYFTAYPNYSSDFWGWQYGPRKIISYFSNHESEYDEQYMIPEFNAPHIFFSFYAPNTCAKCRLGAPHEYSNSSLRQLFAVSPQYLADHPEINLHVNEVIYYPNKTPAFVIGEIK
jgi:4-amino-4-deoxy-L-arabinose transferase-like glycosyltransferase